jgi:hypothetical protein
MGAFRHDLNKGERDEKIVALNTKQGLGVTVLSQRFGLSKFAILQILKKAGAK